MADDLSLLFKLRADNAQAKSTIAETRAAVAQLRASFGSDFSAMQSASKSALSDIGNNLNLFVGERIPLVGGAFIRVTENLHGLHDEMKKGGPEVEKLAQSIDKIAQSTGKSTHEVTSFLTSFVQLETQAKRDAAAIETFGAATAGTLIPQLEKAGTELTKVAAAGEGAGAGFAAIAGPIGIATIAVLALAVAGGVLVEQFFELAKGASEFQGKMFDLSQQTGVSVETLSAFEILAKTTGGSIETITASLGIFQKHLEQAQDPTSKESKLLRELKIDTANTDQALRDALTTLAAMPEGFHQTAVALELFGRGGKGILAIIKEMHGDLDGAIKRFRELGILISTEDAKAADEFNDQLALVGFQLRSITAQLTRDSMPALLDALTEFSHTLKDNREAISAVGEVVSVLARLLNFELRGVLGFINGELLVAKSIWEGIAPPLRVAAELYERIANAVQKIKFGLPDLGGAGASASVSPGTTAGDMVGGTITGGLGAAGPTKEQIKAAELAFKTAIERAAEQAKQEAEIQRHLTEQLRLEHDKGLQDLNDYYTKQQQLVDNHLADVRSDIAKEQAAINTAREGGIVKGEELDKKQAEINLRAREAENKRDEETNRLRLERDRALVQAEVKLRERTSAIAQATRDGELKRNQEAFDSQIISESAFIDRQLELLKQAQTERIGIIDFELKAQSTSAERKAQLDTEKTVSEQKYTDEVKRLTRERADVELAEAAASENRFGPKTGPLGAAPAPPKLNPWVAFASGLKTALGNAGGAVKGFAGTVQALGEIGANALGSLANAVGSMVENWVLMGSQADMSIQKMTAAVLAGVAAQSAVLAVFELAKGFAALFFNPAEAATHFTAAALYGSIAAVTGIAGRLVAGSSFQSKPSGGGGSTGSGNLGGSSSSSASTGPTTITMGRNQIMHVVHTISLAPGLIAKEVVKMVNSNDPIVNHALNRTRS